VAKRFGAREVLKHISLEIASGEFLTLLGESGSGKTTLLRLIAGFEQPSSGEIWMSGERLDTLPPYKRRVNTVFQNYALFPHLTVQENVSYGLQVSGAAKAEIPGRVAEALLMVKMQEFAASRPTKLSGGQQQRVALARALVNRPKLLLSDRIALLKDGALEQVASPREIYAHPATSYTAQFIGQTNLLRAEVRSGVVTWGSLQWKAAQPEGRVIFSLRPEAIHLAAGSSSASDAVRFRARVQQQIFSGSSEHLELDLAGQLLRARIPTRGSLSGEHDFWFTAADAVAVRE